MTTPEAVYHCTIVLCLTAVTLRGVRLAWDLYLTRPSTKAKK